jgi:hypothetical protein
VKVLRDFRGYMAYKFIGLGIIIILEVFFLHIIKFIGKVFLGFTCDNS